MANIILKKRPVALIILSGFGWSPLVEGNAVAQAYTPFLDKYLSAYKHTLLEASGECVGLPLGQAGNSEINHMIIGTGQVAPMTVTRVDEAIATGKFFENPTLVAAIDAGRDSALHLMGLLSDGGVHSRNAHLYALLKMAAERGVRRVFVHVFTDGRDTPPNSGQRYVEELMAKMREVGVGRVATVMGRYYAMDRDNRWERVKRAYDAIALGEGRKFVYPGAAIEASYDGGVTDEFIEPAVITGKNGAPLATTRSGDSAIFFNLRADRARQLTRAFTGLNFDSFERERIQNLHFANFTNADMVGHTGNLKATIEAVESLDACLGWVIGTIERVKGAAIITSDHGNCEQMIDPAGGVPHTAHTTNPVPFVLCDPEFKGTLREGGSLEDVAPTMLELLGVEKPPEMTGRSLLLGGNDLVEQRGGNLK